MSIYFFQEYIMITVHYWSAMYFKGVVGHASVTCGKAYISWWPEKLPLGSVSPWRVRSLALDIEDEQNRSPVDTVLEGLDENSLLTWWESNGLQKDGQDLYGPMLPYNIRTKNCSTIAATALRIAGANAYVKAEWTKERSMWKPSDVHEYASAISRGLAEAKAKKK
jgi:hypothetical protein